MRIGRSRASGGQEASAVLRFPILPERSWPSPIAQRRRARARAVKRHGWNATSFQMLEPGFRYWFDGDDACVAYVDTGRRVGGGGRAHRAPRAARARWRARFEAAARAAGRRVVLLRHRAALRRRARRWGACPSASSRCGTARAGPRRCSDSRSLREQLRRARAKGVTRARGRAAEELEPPRAPLRGGDRAADRRAGCAPADGADGLPGAAAAVRLRATSAATSWPSVDGAAWSAFLAAVPVYARQGGCSRTSCAIRRRRTAPRSCWWTRRCARAAARASGYVTLGLAPLSGAVRGWLRVARLWGAPLYDFEGLRAFKAKLRPARLGPHPPGLASEQPSRVLARVRRPARLRARELHALRRAPRCCARGLLVRLLAILLGALDGAARPARERPPLPLGRSSTGRG